MTLQEVEKMIVETKEKMSRAALEHEAARQELLKLSKERARLLRERQGVK